MKNTPAKTLYHRSVTRITVLMPTTAMIVTHGARVTLSDLTYLLFRKLIDPVFFCGLNAFL
jgi:hypothetical protein